MSCELPEEQAKSGSSVRLDFSGHKNRAIVGQRKMRIPADLPQVAVWVGEIATVPVPKDILSELDDLAARCCCQDGKTPRPSR
jgi:hypothetical protein